MSKIVGTLPKTGHEELPSLRGECQFGGSNNLSDNFGSGERFGIDSVDFAELRVAGRMIDIDKR